jgi:hypothetical protein
MPGRPPAQPAAMPAMPGQGWWGQWPENGSDGASRGRQHLAEHGPGTTAVGRVPAVLPVRPVESGGRGRPGPGLAAAAVATIASGSGAGVESGPSGGRRCGSPSRWPAVWDRVGGWCRQDLFGEELDPELGVR